MLKDRIRFVVPAGDGMPVELEIHVRPDRFGGWVATALIDSPGAPAADRPSRLFRSRDRRLATGKMIAWVRGRYAYARPLASRAAPDRLR